MLKKVHMVHLLSKSKEADFECYESHPVLTRSLQIKAAFKWEDSVVGAEWCVSSEMNGSAVEAEGSAQGRVNLMCRKGIECFLLG